MKWNDVYLPYFGEKKILIHKYILSATKNIKNHFKKEELSSKYIINFIKNDSFWDISIFNSNEEKEWLMNELNNNIHLIAFLITEIEKIIDYPDMYTIPNIDAEKTQEEIKSEEFGKRIFRFLKEYQEIPHFYFSQTDKIKIKNDVKDFVFSESDCLAYRNKESYPPEFEKSFTIKFILEKYIGIKTQPFLSKSIKPFLNITSHDIDLLLVQWGNFPTFSTSNIKPKLICLIDEFSIYILGIADEKLLLQYSSKDFIFSDNTSQNNPRTAFYGFHALKPFSFNEIDKYKKEND